MTYPEKCFARAEKATEGPWEIGYESFTVEAGPMKICDIRGWGYLTGTGGLNLKPGHAKLIQDANAEFIAHARQDVPELAKRLQTAIALIRRYGNGVMQNKADELERSPEVTV